MVPKGEAQVLNADLPVLTATPEKGDDINRSLYARRIIVEWIALRSLEPDITNKDAAARMGIGRPTLQTIITRAAKEGWLKFDDPLNRLEYQVLPKVVDNINRFIEEGDKTVTLETAKGTLFPAYRERQGISDASQTILALKIEPADNQEVKVITGQIVGTPRRLEE